MSENNFLKNFDINKFNNPSPENKRYEKRINYLKEENIDTSNIESTVMEAIKNVEEGINSFVIYGEPQSGKTEMMIALTTKIIDNGFNIIIVLLNDNIPLLDQNLNRFRDAGFDPTPVNVLEILEEDIGNKRWVIFSKKNINDLNKLIEKVRNKNKIVIIDDEADFASPNSKVNKNERTKINNAIYELLKNDSIYIGVTATPARLDLNNTFDNITEKWVYFNPHKNYVGKDTFFPMDLSKDWEYELVLLPDTGDDPKYLQDAILRFLVNVAYINLYNGIKIYLNNHLRNKNFSYLIHTSGNVADHKKDQQTVIKLFDILSDKNSSQYESRIRRMYEITSKKYGEEKSENIINFILNNINSKTIVMMNSKRKTDTDPGKPRAFFTIAIGGNIISRGMTFDNLLGMFFTRDVKHKLQQDTYIQRARMFGNRKGYLNYFELCIPEKLFLDWHKCFVFHYLSLESIKAQKTAPIWISDNRITPISGSSIDKKTIVIDNGEMYFVKFKYDKRIKEILDLKIGEIEKLEKINQEFGEEILPKYVINFIKFYIFPYHGYLAIHGIRNVGRGTADSDYRDDLYRARSAFGGTDTLKYPNAIHHVMILLNTLGNSRIVYKYNGKVKFFKNIKRRK
jgi:hypothetical protein